MDERMKDEVLGSGSAVDEAAFIEPHQLAFGKWYRSKGARGDGSPYASYLMNKKWTFEEKFTNHMLRFQQVTVGSVFCIYFNLSKIIFYIPGWIGWL